MDATFAAVVAIIAIALIFDYTNGFHDAANAIATPNTTAYFFMAVSPKVDLVRLDPHFVSRIP